MNECREKFSNFTTTCENRNRLRNREKELSLVFLFRKHGECNNEIKNEMAP